MRVISGQRRGQKLLSPKNDLSRPTEDRVKEAVFNVIFPIKPNAVVLDLFSCTGSIGIEFLSRGAKKVFFSELKKDNLILLNKNIKNTKYEDESKVLAGDFRKNIQKINENVDYVYIDPPFDTNFYSIAIEKILENNYLKDALIITEMDINENFSEKYDKIQLVFERKYGNIFIKMYRRTK